MSPTHIIRRIRATLPLLFLCIVANGQLSNYYFNHLIEEDGLLDNLVFCALMDSRGYVWFGTHNGLSRWDGIHFKSFTANPRDSSKLSSPIVKDIAEDHLGNIWIATIGGGLHQYDPILENLKRFESDDQKSNTLSGNSVVSLLIDADNTLWAGTFNDGFNSYDFETGNFKRYSLKSELKNSLAAFKQNTVHDIIQDTKNNHLLWIAGDDGLYRFDKKTEQLEWFPSSAEGTSGMSIHQLWMDQDNSLWIATYGGGLAKVNTNNPGQWQYFPPKIEKWNNRSASDNIIMGLAKKSKNEFWVASQDMGLGIFDTRQEKYSFFKMSNASPHSISSEKLNNLYVDAKDRVWALHHQRGVSFYDPSTHVFIYHPLEQENCRSFSNGEITDFAYNAFNDQIYLTGAACDGFFILNKQKEVLRKIPMAGFEGLYQIYSTILVDSKGVVWVGGKHSRGLQNDDFNRPSLLQLNTQQNILEPFNHPNLESIPIQENNIRDIIEDQQGNIWIGSDIGGLIKISPKRETITLIKPPSDKLNLASTRISIGQILELNPGELWISTHGDGLLHYNTIQDTWTQFKRTDLDDQQIAENISGMALTKDSSLILGSNGDGLQLFYPFAENKIEWYSLEAGLNNGTIDEILIDREENIWATTRKGLSLFKKEQERFFSFGSKYGLKDELFFSNGLEEMPWGEILIGSKRGFYSFNPDSLLKKSSTPKLVLTEFKIFEEVQEFEKNINYLEEIKLQHDQNYFSIAYSGLNFSQSDANQYSYYLENYDPGWIYPSDNRSVASYTNLNPGNYIFHLKNSNTKGEETKRSLRINVMPPWYLSNWAYLAYAFLIGLSTYLIYYYQRRRWLLQTQLQIEQAEAKRLKELDSFKSRFFTNFTHEFRTPLTMVIGLANQIRENTKVKVMEKAETIRRNGLQLLDLINQILDLAKLEEGKLKAHYVQGDIAKFLNYLCQSLQSNAFSKNVQLACFTEPEQIVMDYDPEKLERIIINLISNAIKFTPEFGTIKLIARQKGSEHIEIIVQDTGIGIKKEDQAKIFNRFFQSIEESHSEKGSGIGLALVKELIELMNGEIELESQLGKGSIFKISLPIINNAPIQEKIQQTNTDLLPQSHKGIRRRLSPIQNKLEDIPLILLVEDNTDVIEYLKSLLEFDYKLLEAMNGNEGKKLALEEIPDLIISDVMMPGLNGLQLCELLKEDEKTCHIPIILLTGKSTTEERLEGLKHGADVYLNKPFNQEELLIRIRKLIENRKTLWKKYSNKAFLLDSEIQNDLDKNFLRKVYHIIEEHMDDPDFGTAQLCKQIFMSRTSLHRKIKALTGKPTANFIESVRLEKAKELLINTDLTAKEIAYSIGFNDPSHFSKAFKRLFGQAPGETRK